MKSENTGLFSVAEAGNKLGKQEYEDAVASLRVELLNLQFDLQDADFSMIVVLAGDDRPGCADTVRTLHEWMDARYIDTYILYAHETEADAERPILWHYWRRLPPRGRTGLFLGAWPAFVVQRSIAENWSELETDGALDHIERFEHELTVDGTLLLKFWLHIPESELGRRLKEAKKDSSDHWWIEDRDWEIHDNYDAFLRVSEQTVRRTNTPEAAWSIVESTDRRYRNLTVGQQIAEALRNCIEAGPQSHRTTASALPTAQGQNIIDRIDLSATVPVEAYKKELKKLQSRLNGLSRSLVDAGDACVLVFEGVDAAGKGGAIRRLTAAMPIQSVRVIPIAAPSDEELARHYLWRFWRHVPAAGKIVIFDRSWYGRVLVERVEGFAPDYAWQRAYEEINDFESILHESGIPVIKFWLQIDADEQLRRFESRAETPYKKYKLTDEDFRNREKWDLYQEATHDMITRTSTRYAPWNLVAANDKRHARLSVLRIVCERLEEHLDGHPKGGGKNNKGGKSRKGK